MFGKSRVFAIVAKAELVDGAEFVAKANFVAESGFSVVYR